MKEHLFRIGSFALCCTLGITVLSACKNEDMGDDFDLPEAPAGAIVTGDDIFSLRSGQYRLDFVKRGEGYAVELSASDAAPEGAIFSSQKPAAVTVMTNKKLLSYSTSEASRAYENISAQKYGYLCTATVTTENGSEISFSDRYYLSDGTFALSRTAEVTAVAQGDFGFETVYSLSATEKAKDHTAFDYFMPSILYKDSRDMTNGAQGSNLAVPKMYVKETRMGYPLAMIRDKQTGYSVALAHLEPQIGVSGIVSGGSNGSADNHLQYGSVGYSSENGMGVDFCYPCAEMQGSGWTRIFHEMEKGSLQTYKLSILPEKRESYAESMTQTFKAAYRAESPEVSKDVNIDSIYDDNLEVFSATYKEFGPAGSIEAGVPFSVDLGPAQRYGAWTSSQGYSFQMGFIGQQTSIAYFLLREGVEKQDGELTRKGKTMLDFWASEKIMGTALPAVWWDPNNGSSASAGAARDYPCFLRCFTDGMEGMLDACVYAKKNGIGGYESWERAVLKVGAWMAENQNDDGSFYRAYERSGDVCARTDEYTWQGTSKLNTPVAVRFLVRLYEYTGEEKYRTAAEEAAEFCYNTLYLDHEKYVGGTPDNPNTVDKEAAIYALYAFDAAYELTGEEKYLTAAEHAAASALSWVYLYDFAVPSGGGTTANTFEDGGVSGFSLIATGHSGADNYSAVLYYEFFKMYLHTGDEFYLDAAYFLQQNTKLSSDYDGKTGYAFRALCPEATGVADFALGGSGAKLWLVWCGAVNVQPIVYMRSTFGEADIQTLADTPVGTLRATLAAYGSGGKAE